MKQTLKTKIIDLSRKGLKPKDIASRLNTHVNYVYGVRFNHKSEWNDPIAKILKPVIYDCPVQKKSILDKIKALFGV